MYDIHKIAYKTLKSYIMNSLNKHDNAAEMVYISIILQLIESDIKSDTQYINENILTNIMKESPSDLINNIKANSDMINYELLNIIESSNRNLSVYLISSDVFESKRELEDSVLEFLYLEYDN